jgi:phosphoglucosamine mutase
LRARGWQVGGENSGHILCLDRHTTGDGIVSALQVLAAMRRGRQSLAEVAGSLVLFPQVLVNVRTTDARAYRDDPGVSAAVAEADATLGSRGRVLLRPSGTEPVVRVMVESDQESLLRGVDRRGDPQGCLSCKVARAGFRKEYVRVSTVVTDP